MNPGLWIIGATIGLYLFAAVLVLRLVRLSGWRREWWLITVLLVFLGARRGLEIQTYLQQGGAASLEMVKELQSFTIALILVLVILSVMNVYREASSAKDIRKQVERKSDQLQALHQTGLELARQTDTDVLMNSILKRAIDLMQSSGGVIYWYRPDLDVLELYLGIGEGIPPVGEQLRRGDGLSGKVWISRQTTYVNDYHHWDGRFRGYDTYNLGAILAAPVCWGDDLLGVLDIIGHPGRNFNEDDARLLEQFALQAAIALHNTIELEKTRRQAAHQRLLNEITGATLEQEDTTSMLETLANRLGELFDADECYMSLWDEANQQAIPAAAYGSMQKTYANFQVLLGETSVTEVILRLGRPLAVEDVADSTVISPQIAARFPVRSGIGLPMMSGQEKLGSAIVGYYRPRNFSADEMARAEQAARLLSLALLKARLLETVKESAGSLEKRVAERTAELNAANLKLEEAARRLVEVNAELESFTYTVSHDLRAPLRALQGFAVALNEDHAEDLGEAGRNYTRRMVETARRMDRQILDLLEYSQLTRLDICLAPVELQAALDAALQRLEAEIEARGAQVMVPARLPCVLAHAAILEQVLANLVGNALIYVEPGVRPRVTIRAEAQPAPGGEATAWRVWVEDNGIGIEARNHARIFKVFERLHGVESYPGSGIGLAIVQKGVTRMGGRAGVESSPGEGSKFWIELQPVV